MARKSSPTIVQEELYPPHGEEQAREELDDARLIDLDVEEESPFLRGQKRVSARRGPLPKKAIHWIKWVGVAAMVVGVAALAGAAVYQYGEHSWRFRIDSSDNIQIAGAHNVTHAQLMEVMGGDIGRNIFFVPLAERKAQLEKIPWVESASVMRFVPNRLAVEIHERTPVAFARVGSRIHLIDAGGTLMELPGPGKQKYSFPVIVGINPSDPAATRSARMNLYNDLVRQLDADGAHYSQALSEVDISDPEDVKVLANDSAGDVQVHLGSTDFLNRYRIYVSHVQSWRQQFEKLDSVDLRYDKQIIVNPDGPGMTKAPQLTPAAAKAAMAAGVKPAALIHVVSTKPVPAPRTALAKSAPTQPKNAAKPAKPASPKSAAAKPNAKTAGKPGKPGSKTAAAKANAAKPVAKNSSAPHGGPSPAGPAAGKQANAAVGGSGGKPTTPATASAPATSGTSSDTTSTSKKKPSAAIAKVQDQQDHD
jgi:cell division protein FtsQ